MEELEDRGGEAARVSGGVSTEVSRRSVTATGTIGRPSPISRY
jgi:hypothetical protein